MRGDLVRWCLSLNGRFQPSYDMEITPGFEPRVCQTCLSLCGRQIQLMVDTQIFEDFFNILDIYRRMGTKTMMYITSTPCCGIGKQKSNFF